MRRSSRLQLRLTSSLGFGVGKWPGVPENVSTGEGHRERTGWGWTLGSGQTSMGRLEAESLRERGGKPVWYRLKTPTTLSSYL